LSTLVSVFLVFGLGVLNELKSIFSHFFKVTTALIQALLFVKILFLQSILCFFLILVVFTEVGETQYKSFTAFFTSIFVAFESIRNTYFQID
jgi:hypothetical protein